MKKFLLLSTLAAASLLYAPDADAQGRDYIPQTKFSREFKIPRNVQRDIGNNDDTINRALGSNKRDQRRKNAAERRKNARQNQQQQTDQNSEDRTQSESKLSDDRSGRAQRHRDAMNRSNTRKGTQNQNVTAKDGLND